jgi:hypothetical protein
MPNAGQDLFLPEEIKMGKEERDKLDILGDQTEDILYAFHSQTAFDKAQAEGLQVVLPTPKQLFIDIDSGAAFSIFEKNLERFQEFYNIRRKVITPSKSGGAKKHITIDLAFPVTPTERLVLQAFLGSDLMREFLGMQRINQNDPHPTLFLEKKPTPGNESLTEDERREFEIIRP